MRYKKITSIVLSVLMLCSTSVGAYAQNNNSENDYTKGLGIERKHQLEISSKIQKTFDELNITDMHDAPIEVLVLSQLENDITSKLYKAGAIQVKNLAEGLYKIRIMPRDAKYLSYISEIVSLGKNHTIELEETERVPMADPNLEYSNQVTSIKELWDRGYDGSNTKIAVIDTGVEPDHELLKMTYDGKLKITDFQDFTNGGFTYDNPSPQEGDIKLTEIMVTSNNVVIPFQYLEKNEYGKVEIKDGTKNVTVPDEMIGHKVLGGVFTEYKMLTLDDRDNQNKTFDVNKNGEKDRFSIICLDKDGDGTFDRMLFDTDNDNELQDEKEIGIYKDIAAELSDQVIFQMDDGEPVLDDDNNPVVLEQYKEKYGLLVNTVKSTITEGIEADTKFNFVLTRIDKETFGSWYANIGYDSRGHGTHVSGDAAASGYLAHDFVDADVEPTQRLIGAAPNAQVMALKVFTSGGGTSEEMYLKAMCYAAVNGADVVNMSLGSQPDITDGSSMGAQYADLLTTKYGTIFTISNGNNGFGINSNGSPGDSLLAITVGAYCPSFYTFDGSAKDTENKMWIFSSVGPSDDGKIKPDIVAPGSMISASPMWRVTGRGYDESGTFKDYADNPVIGYARDQGTSMSSPYVAGVVACLMQSVKEEEIPYHPLLLKEAITKSGYKEINGSLYNAVEIGHGMVNPVEAYEELVNIKNSDMLPKLVTGDVPTMKWPYDFKDRNLKFTKFQDIYLSNNVLYKNTERMKWVNAQGVYVRDKDIPDYVDVEISNLTGKDINADITKVFYGENQSADWLEVQNDFQLGTGKKGTLRLHIEKDELAHGVNVILVQMDDPSTYQIDNIIPVTVINSEKIEMDNSVITQNNITSPGGYTRQFIKIDKDQERFKVVLEVPELSDSLETVRRVRPAIYCPNGLKYHFKEEGRFIGYQRPWEIEDVDPGFRKKVEIVIDKKALEEAALDFKKYNPNKNFQWEGVWEIDVISSITSDEDVESVLTVSNNDVLISEKARYLELDAGEIYNGELEVLNNSDKDLFVKSHGFVNMEMNKVVERIEGMGEFNSIERLFEIKAGEKNIFQKVIVTNASYGEGARVWLYLYKANVNPDGSYELIKPMINKYINFHLNGMESEMVTYNLEPGFYVYVGFAGALEYGPVDFDFINQIVNESHAVEDTVKLENGGIVGNDETRDVNYTVKAPVDAGEYMARITFENSDGEVVKSLPIYAEVEGTRKFLSVKQDKVALNNEEFILNINAAFPEESLNKEKLYGLEFELEYNPQELSAHEILTGDVFTEDNSYKVKTEVLTDESGAEIGKIKFAYAFKGRGIYGVHEGNVAKIKFTTNKIGVSSIDVNGLSVGNYLGDELAVKVSKENIVTANPDVNNDGVVNIKDYAYCAFSYGADKDDVRYRVSADVNRDGRIDDTDVNYIIENFNY